MGLAVLDQDIRTAILCLHAKGHSARAIARDLRVSRNSVKDVIRSGTAEVPKMVRPQKADPLLGRIRELYGKCESNLVRVQEILEAEGVALPYSTLTGFCRRHRIGHVPKPPAGEYHFAPGEEMQHDTSPHDVTIGGRRRRVQCATLFLHYSRRIYSQVYPRWTRFEVRLFLTDALKYHGGACHRNMIDNSSVIIARGTGKDAIPAAEMEALAERFGFAFEAHDLGDVNRSAGVERSFRTVEKNFYPGRDFADLADLNRQLVAWCDQRNGRFHKRLRAVPNDLYAVELPAMARLPLHVPEIYEFHGRSVDLEGYVNLHTNRYSAPPDHVGRELEVREYKETVRLLLGPRTLAVHPRFEYGAHGTSMLPEHEAAAKALRSRQGRKAPVAEEKPLRAAGPEMDALVDALRRHHGGRAVRAIRHLHRLWLEYPTEPVLHAVRDALHYGLLDLGRLERMILRRIGDDFFQLSTTHDPLGAERDP